MIHLELRRVNKLLDRTIGELYVDGEYFCNTLEDRDRGLSDNMSEEAIRKNKVYAETAIPIGRYEVLFTYSPKFQKKMPLLMRVKGFEGIRIHRGSKPEHSAGCILIKETEKLEELYKIIASDVCEIVIK